jgi:hypothetical protein
VVQGLVRRLNASGLDPGRYRLDALAVAWQQQPSAIPPNRSDAVGMSKRVTECLDIG